MIQMLMLVATFGKLEFGVNMQKRMWWYFIKFQILLMKIYKKKCEIYYGVDYGK